MRGRKRPSQGSRGGMGRAGAQSNARVWVGWELSVRGVLQPLVRQMPECTNTASRRPQGATLQQLHENEVCYSPFHKYAWNDDAGKVRDNVKFV